MHRYTEGWRSLNEAGVWPGAERDVCACIKIGDFLVKVAGLGISLESD